MTKFFGGIFLIAGTAIGAGMLGIPYSLATVGFKWALLLIVLNWLFMLITAILIIEINITQPLHTDFNSIALSTLGRKGQIVHLFIYLFLLYALTTAYIAIGTTLLNDYISMNTSLLSNLLCAFLFCIIFGIFLFFGTSAVEKLNKFFFILKIFIFLGLVYFVLPNLNVTLLDSSLLGYNHIWCSFPVLITAFGFHIIIPSLRNYFCNDMVLKKIVITGSLVPLSFYLIWITITLGVIPIYGENSFSYLINNNKSIAIAYSNLLNSRVSFLLYSFSNLAVVTSFLGVTLALFNFNKDLYKLNSKFSNIILNFVITYIPPLVFSVFFIKNFLIALGYASIFVCILLLIFPSIMVWVLRSKENKNNFFSKLLLIVIILFGIFVIVLQILAALNYIKVL